jgi:hypothetical protein
MRWFVLLPFQLFSLFLRCVCWQDNLIRGRFLAELTREVFTDLEASKYQHAEMRISIYGRKQVGPWQQHAWQSSSSHVGCSQALCA